MAVMSAVPGESPKPENAGKKAKDLNEVVRYTLWSVFRLREPLPEERGGHATEVEELFEQLAAKDVVVRGVYDLSGLRADADVLIWWHAEVPEALQDAYSRFRRTRLGRELEPVWSNMALHRPAEFNKSHVPAFLAGEAPRDYVSVYPFVRSYDWYLLPDEDRRRMLADHGRMARGYPDVRANTVASFSLEMNGSLERSSRDSSRDISCCAQGCVQPTTITSSSSRIGALLKASQLSSLATIPIGISPPSTRCTTSRSLPI
jgi:hydrogen peroxide-dependent heme synthase